MSVKSLQKYNFAAIAADVVILSIRGDQLCALLTKVVKPPFSGRFALPGGLVKPKESVEQTAMRHIQSTLQEKDLYTEQLYTFGDTRRDPNGRVVSVAYLCLLPPEKIKQKNTSSQELRWFPVHKFPRLAYDHDEITAKALKRLKAKMTYTNIVSNLLPKEFTFSELQNIYEELLQKKFDKRNFRKKILALHLVKKTAKKKMSGAHRPAELYAFVTKTLQIIHMI